MTVHAKLFQALHFTGSLRIEVKNGAFHIRIVKVQPLIYRLDVLHNPFPFPFPRFDGHLLDYPGAPDTL